MDNKWRGAILGIPFILSACTDNAPDERRGPASAAIAPTITDIAGLRVGHAQTLPECEKYQDGRYVMYRNPYTPRPCWTRPNGPGKTVESDKDQGNSGETPVGLDVYLSPTAVPTGVNSIAHLTLMDGVTQQVTLDTDGAASQSEIYSLLIDKYGKPSSSNVVSKQNGFGAHYDDIEALWSLASMTVVFIGVTSADSGSIVAMSPKAIASKHLQPTATSF